MEYFANKVVWITGASSGIGEALAYELAKAGAKLILSSRREEELERVRAACRFAEKHLIVPLDLEKHLEVENTVNRVLQEQGPIDVLINNAGISQRYLVADACFDLDKKIIDINFLGVLAITRPILKNMLQHDRGQIVVISSMLGLYGMQTRSAYSASKHALRGYFESLRNELVHTKVSITLVYPGYINTHITENALLNDGHLFGKMDSFHAKAIPAPQCAKKIVHAISHKKAIVVVSGFKERFGVFMSRFFPAFFRWLAPRFKV